MIPVSGNRIYVNVYAEFSYDGEIKPLEIGWYDGRRFSIDRILDCRKGTSYVAGGLGIRYTCIICGYKRYLFHGDNNRWYVERRE